MLGFGLGVGLVALPPAVGVAVLQLVQETVGAGHEDAARGGAWKVKTAAASAAMEAAGLSTCGSGWAPGGLASRLGVDRGEHAAK